MSIFLLSAILALWVVVLSLAFLLLGALQEGVMRTLFPRLGQARPPWRRAARFRHCPAVERLDDRCLLDAGMGYVQSKLVSDVPGLALITDRNLLNPWDFSPRRLGSNG